MARDPRYDVLFEPVRIGPKTAKNRFYQVPHTNAMGWRNPHGERVYAAVKAEGGWATVCGEQCSIHPSADTGPFCDTRLWDEGDARQLGALVDAIHAYDALAGIELAHSGFAFGNRMTRETNLAPSALPVLFEWDPVAARAMDLEDIAAVRRWQADAARRAVSIGYDIVYVYAAHAMGLPQHFLSPLTNQRSDEYGGSMENRARLIGEMIETTLEACADRAAVALRFAVDEMQGSAGITWEREGVFVVEAFAELPDLWDVNVSGWEHDSGSSRFYVEGHQEPYIRFVKQRTTKPVVGVGRYTSPDAMLAAIEGGVVDLIGAARPSIADPFLPKKIEEGRLNDIRECIGCNICVASENTAALLRCTQNPAIGEEWRRGWHPETIEKRGSERQVLIVGAGPAGLECARALGQRGYDLHLVEAESEPGGRVARESRLPGLAAWDRVAAWRRGQIKQLKSIEVITGTRLGAQDVLDYGADTVVIATGAAWRRDGVSHNHRQPIPGVADTPVFTPDDIMAGRHPDGPVVVFDDDHYYMGGVIAELLARDGLAVALACPLPTISHWTAHTLEQERVIARLVELGVELLPNTTLAAIHTEGVELTDLLTGKRIERAGARAVLVASRLPDDALYRELAGDTEWLARAGIATLGRVGDALAPGTIQSAVYAGHRFARELDAPPVGTVPFRVERLALDAGK